MKSPAFRIFAGLVLLWTVAELVYYAVVLTPMEKAEWTPSSSQETRATVAPTSEPDSGVVVGPDGEIRVLVMPNGLLYHNASCKKVVGGKYIPFSEARRLGYTSCLTCGG